MPGTFRVDRAFVISQRGLVLAGHVVAGTVRIGESVAIPEPHGSGRYARITAVESGHGQDESGKPWSFTGLVLGHSPEIDLATVQALLVPGLLVAVADP
jgi:hypothetical protein